VVLQQWDLSCGAAALATLLNFQHGDRVTEREVALGMMSREEYVSNPSIVTIRQGFSLLDMKRYVETLGYVGVGIGQLTFEHLVMRAPMIVPVNARGYQHFVVFRGATGNRVLLADPAFGNRTMTRSHFEEIWMSLKGMGRVGFEVRRGDTLIPPNTLAPTMDEFVTFN
jgi:predicted double-glycine peptidase